PMPPRRRTPRPAYSKASHDRYHWGRKWVIGTAVRISGAQCQEPPPLYRMESSHRKTRMLPSLRKKWKQDTPSSKELNAYVSTPTQGIPAFRVMLTRQQRDKIR